MPENLRVLICNGYLLSPAYKCHASQMQNRQPWRPLYPGLLVKCVHPVTLLCDPQYCRKLKNSIERTHVCWIRLYN